MTASHWPTCSQLFCILECGSNILRIQVCCPHPAHSVVTFGCCWPTLWKCMVSGRRRRRTS